MPNLSTSTTALAHDQTIPIVIAHYRAPDALRTTVALAQAQTGVRVEVFVRDNSDDNILFTQAINEGLEKYCFNGAHEYVLLLNHDAYMEPNCLAELVREMNKHPNVGIGCPVQLGADGQATWFGSLQAFPFGVHATGALDPRSEPFATYWANGACMLLRTAMVREIGLLDTNMRFICSDADYSFTARSRGWEVMVVPAAHVHHTLGASGQVSASWLEAVKLQDVLHFTHKWLTGGLYRRLAYEGLVLEEATVRSVVCQLDATLKAMRPQHDEA